MTSQNMSLGVRLRRWFEIRPGETLDAYRQRQFERLSLSATLFLFIFCPSLCLYALALGDMQLLLEFASTQVVIIVGCMITYYLARKGQMNVAGLLFNLSLIGVTLGGIAVTGMTRGALMFLAVGVIISALVFSARVILWVTLANVIGLILLFTLRPPVDVAEPKIALVMHIGFLTIIGGLSFANSFGNKRQFERLEEARRTDENANAAKSEFLANMTHELRTPLTSIIGYAELIGEDAEDLGVDAFDADLERVLGSAHHLLSLINDVLDLSKIEADMLPIQTRTIALQEVFEEFAGAARILTDRRGNQLTIDLGEDLGEVECDPMRLRQIALNLLSNSAKFTEHGQITLRASRAATQWWFEVEDDGIGMSPEQQERVFHKFEQATDDTSTLYGGTGLGLALVERLVEALGGELSLQSQLGQGTTFRVTFPC